MSNRDVAFTEYFVARSDAMRGTAYLLCGDWHRAEDLVQAAFTKLYLAWHQVSRHDVLDGYVRRILVRTFLDEQRRGFWRREKVGATTWEPPTPVDPTDDRLVLLRALESVAPRQRAVLILRFWEDLSVDETAALLQCSPGTVKSQSARGLDTLRAVLATPTAARGTGRNKP
jgi:RNA polymerase sigma-70 factor (sigma-E family)